MKSKNIEKTYSTIGKFFTMATAFVFLAFSATFVNAQVSNGTISVDIDQCANGPANAPQPCTGSAWQNGNLNGSQAHWSEGDSVAYRDKLTGLPIGQSYTITVQYDTTQNGKHAEDFITDYNRTETTADPCSGIADCTLVQGPLLPTDPQVTNGPDGISGTSDDIIQIPGHFYISGGTITGYTAYSYTGSFDKDAKTSIGVTFTTSSSTVVLAWGGHISTRLDWGFNSSAVNISGSPYHMRNLSITGPNAPNLGNQDRSLTASAIVYPALIKIIKSVDGVISVNGAPFEYTTSSDTFDFFITDNGGHTNTNFPLIDQVTGTAPSNPDSPSDTSNPDWQIFSYGTGALPASGTVSEPNVSSSGLSLVDIQCSLIHGSTNTGSFDTSSGALTFTGLDQGDGLTCTFVNSRANVTAAKAMVTGTVTVNGKGVKGATVMATDIMTGEAMLTKTNAKGEFKFTELATTDGYTFSASAAGYSFNSKTYYSAIGSSLVVNIDGTSTSTKGGGKNK